MSYLQARVTSVRRRVADARTDTTSLHNGVVTRVRQLGDGGEEGVHDVNRRKAVVRVLEVLRHAVLVAAELLALHIGVRHWHNFDVVLFDADWTAAVPSVGVEGVELACMISRHGRGVRRVTCAQSTHQETWTRMTSGEWCDWGRSFRMTRTTG